MEKSHIDQIFSVALEKIISEKLSEGVPEETIRDVINSSKFLDLHKSVIEDICKSAVNQMEITMYETVLEQRSMTKEFLARLEQKWGKCFISSELLYMLSLEAGKYFDDLNKEDKPDQDNAIQNTYLALTQIHGRACQEYLEILCLNKNGFADGAYARWRSLYELSVISEFILVNGEEVAKAFIKAANSNDRYEWARKAECYSKLPQNKYVTFGSLQSNCDFTSSEWKDEYNFANKLVHASPQGTFHRLGSKIESNIISAGHSDYGMTLPAVQSAISLSMITANLLSLIPNGESSVYVSCMHKWIDILNKHYEETEEECFKGGCEPKILK